MGHNKDVGYWTETDDNIVSDSSIYSDGFKYCLQKGQKLSAAIHLVTDHLVQEEPLRTSIRALSIRFVELLPSLRRSNETLSECYFSIGSLLSIASGAKLISSGNASILLSEYEALLQLCLRLHRTENKVLTKESLAVDNGFEARLLNRPLSREKLAPQKVTTEQNRDKERSPERRKIILDLLSKTSKVTVRDLASVINGVSEKTLQRELISMVEEGVLKKEGERRWSTYSMSMIESPLKDIN